MCVLPHDPQEKECIVGAELGDGRTDTTGGSLEDVSVHSDSQGRRGDAGRGGGARAGEGPPADWR